MKSIMTAVSIIGCIFGLFLLIPLLTRIIPDFKTLKSGEMKLTEIRSVTTGADSNSHLVGIETSTKQEFTLSPVDAVLNYLDWSYRELRDNLQASNTTIPVWYSSSGKAILRTSDAKKPSLARFLKKSLTTTLLFFLPAIFMLLHYLFKVVQQKRG